ncbi:unnamed protein product [Symbiodinium sp. CCMP2592]|nr:unnamed protein product [Symbiodinium sp. CCMP2592]
MKGGKSGFGHWNFMKGKGKSGKGMKGNFKGSGKGKGGKEGYGKKGTSGSGKTGAITCWTCGQIGHTSRECPHQYRVSAVDETSGDWNADWTGEYDAGHDFGDAWDASWDDASWIGAIDDFTWQVDAWDDGSWWTSAWNEDPWAYDPTSFSQASQPATSSETSNQAPVPPAATQTSATSADKVSAVTFGEPPGLSLPDKTSKAKASPKPKASTASGLLLAAAESTVSAFKPVYYHADRWHFDPARNVLVRYHKRPRKNLFVPSGTSDRPVALNKLAQERKTFVVDAQGNEKELTDNWVTSDEPTRALDHFWKGRTEFKLTTPPNQRPPTRLLQKRSLLTPPAHEDPKASPPVEQARTSRAPVATESFRPEISLYPKRSDFQKSLREASDGNEASVRRFVASQLQEPDPSTGLPYEHDFWLDTPLMWIRFHFVPRSTLFVPNEEELQGGPDVTQLGRERMTCLCTSEGDQWREDNWDFESEASKREVGFTFTGATCFAKPEEEVVEPLPVPVAGEDTDARVPKRLPAEDQVSKELLDSLKATPWDPRGRQEESAHFVLPAQSEASPAAAPAVSDPQGAQDAAGSSADGTSGSKRSAEAPPEDAPSQLRARLEQSQGEKREISAEVPDSATKLRRISAVLEDRLVDTSCVASVTTRDGLEVPVEVNVDRAEELQALRASVYLLCYVDDVLLFGAKEPCEHLFAKLQAELYSIGLGTSESLFVKSLLIEMNITSRVNIRVFTDSSAGKSMSTRFGVSKKTRHVELRYLFMQELVQQNILQVKKVAGTSNPADVLTKYVSREVLQRMLCRKMFHFNSFALKAELPFQLQGLHGRRRSFGLRLRASLRCRHGFCLGFLLLAGFLATSLWYSFLHVWFANFTPDCAHFGWDMEFFTSYRIVPTSVGTWFWYRLLCDRRLQWFVCFYFEKMAPKLQVPVPKAVALGLPPAALPGPSTSEEAEMTRDFRNFVEEHQFYVPDPNFERDELPPRLPTRALPQNTWLELRYASGHFETVCGLHPAHFQQLHRAVDVLRVHFYGKEAARLLGHGRDHLGWSHFAGMSYFAVDNVCFTHFKHVPDFLESLRQGRQISKLLLPGTSDFRLVYALLRLQPGVDNPVVTALQSAALFPELFARSTSYVANETDFCVNFKASYIGPNFVDVLPEPSIRLWFCTSLNFILTRMSRDGDGELHLTSDMQPFSPDMLNFAFSPRSAVWLACFGLQLLLETSPTEANRVLQGGIGLLSFRMTSSEILNFVEGNRFRFWNRRYIDYFINVPGEHFVLRPHLRTSLAVIRLPGNFQQFFDLAWSKTSHGFNRYMHIPMRTSDFARFENTSEADSWVSRELAVQLLRARY